MMDTDLQATCSALGYHEDSRYVKEPDCIETVKELIRFLRCEDDTCDVRRQLGHAQILQTDLLPLLKQHHNDRALLDTVIRLLVNLTQPVLACFNQQLPDERTLRQHCLEIESHLQQYKEAFVDEELFSVLSQKMTQLLEKDWEQQREEDRLMLERLLVLVRNILHIPPDPNEQRTDDDASVHDQILWAIHVSGMEDLLLYMASSQDQRQLCMHVLEIVSLMFRQHSPEVLAFAGVQRSMTEKEKDEKELEVARAKEKAQKKAAMLRFNTRHSNFGGTYVMKNTQSLSEKEIIFHKNIRDADTFSLDDNKKRRKKAKNRAPIKDTPLIRRSTLSIRLGLKEFCVQFLENAYNPLMYAVKDNLVRETTQELDETYYMWAMTFFMEFCRHHSGHIDFVSETMSVNSFHYLYNNLLRYYEMIMVEKKEAVVWGRRVHLALRAYGELLLTLNMMSNSSNTHLRDSARVITSNVFYVMEFRDVFITLLKKFNESKNSRAYLKDLIEATHLFVRMLEKATKASRHLVVKGKGRNKKKKVKKASANQQREPSQQELEDQWLEVSSELSDLLQGRGELPPGVAPFDAASEVDIEQQRVDAMVRIQSALRQKRPGEAVALFRAAREVWPENEEFGSQDISTEQEFLALQQVFMAPLPSRPDSSDQPEEMPAEEEENVEEEEEVEAARTDFEEEFNFTAYLMNYAKPEILKAYVTLAQDFESNSVHTNHCIVKMLHRVGFDLGYTPMLFQASLFRVLHKVMLGPAARASKYKELYTFGVHVIRKFSEVAARNKKVFMELMFWKGSKEAMQITEGYDYNPGSQGKVTWTEDEDNELMRLFEDFNGTQTPERDLVSMIQESWTGRDITRLQIIRQLKNLSLITSAKDLKPKQQRVHAWSPEDEEELERVYKECKDDPDPVGSVMLGLGKKRSRQTLMKKLLELGVVKDRSELHKKRGRSGGKQQRHHDRGDHSDDDDRSDDSDDNNDGDSSDNNDNNDNNDNLPSDEELLSSPTASEASSDDNDNDNDDDSDNNDDDGDDAASSLDASSVRASSTDQRPSSSSSSSPDVLLTKVTNLLDKGYREPLNWIQRAVLQTANNRQTQGVAVAVPLVPLTEENEDAMEDAMFTDLLTALGLTSPATEQEMFWRIPADLPAAYLQGLAQGLTLDQDGQLVNPQALTSLQTLRPPPAASKADRNKNKKKKKQRDRKADKDRKKKEKKKKKEKERKRKERKKEEEERKKNKERKSKKEEKKKSKRKTMNSDDDDDDDKSDGSDVEGGQGSGGEGGQSDDHRSGVKAVSAAQRRQALQAMMQRRRKGNKDSRGSSSQQTPAGAEAEDQTEGAAVEAAPTTSSSSRKRVRRSALDSEEDNMETSDLEQDVPSSSTKPSKRSRLLDSDDEDSDDDKENRNHSALNYTSDVGAPSGQSQSQSQSQGLLDFGDDSDDDDAEKKKKERDDNKDKNNDKVDDDGDDDSSDDDDVPLVVKKRKAEELESFPATLLSQGPPASDDSDLDDHVMLGTLKKKGRVISDDDSD